MATRLYMTNTAAPYTPATKRGAWDKSTQTLARHLGPRPSGAATTVNVTPGSTAANTDVLWGRWISDPAITAGTLAGTVSWVIGVLEANAACNGFWHIHAFVTAGDSDTVRGTILTDSIGATEFTTTATARGEGNKTLTSVSVQVGDRICVEVGYQASSDTTTRSMIMNYGNTGLVDATQGSTSVTTQPGWFEFSGADGLFYSPVSGIVDDFSSGSYANPPWSGNYGSPTIVSGVARIPATSSGGTPQYAGIQADPPAQGYELDSVFAKLITVPSSVGVTAEAYTDCVVFDPATAGTYVGWVYDAVAAKLCALNAVGYADVTTRVELTFSSPTWVRLRRSGANLLWDTSSDGASWTNQRTETAPSWVNYHGLGLLLEAARDGGSNDFGEWDNVNVVATTHNATGTGSGTGSASATRGVEFNGSGTASGAAAGLASGVRDQSAAGTASGAGSAAASAAADLSGAATGAGVGAGNGTGEVVRIGTGASSGTGLGVASAVLAQQAAGTSQGSAGESGSAWIQTSVLATGSGNGSAAATAVRTQDASATTGSAAASTGSATAERNGDGSSAGLGVAVASGLLALADTGVADAAGSTVAVGAVVGWTTGTAAGTGAAIASADAAGDGSGTSSGVGAASAAATAEFAATGQSTGAGSASADGLRAQDAVGTSSGTAACAATADTAGNLDATGTAISSGSATAGAAVSKDADGQSAGAGNSAAVGETQRSGVGSTSGSAGALADGSVARIAIATAFGVAATTAAAVASSDRAGASAGSGSASAVAVVAALVTPGTLIPSLGTPASLIPHATGSTLTASTASAAVLLPSSSP